LAIHRDITHQRFEKGINRWKAGFIMAPLADGNLGRSPMANHSVKLRVTPFLRIECKFWLTDDGWNGSCEQPSITVQAGSFEHAKSEMEMALGKYIESLLGEVQPSSTGQAA
jgi:hypothetical protein